MAFKNVNQNRGNPEYNKKKRNRAFTAIAKDMRELSLRDDTPLVRRRADKPIDPKQARAETFSKYKGNIEIYAKDFFGITLWKKQLEIVQALETHNFVCVRSAHSTGKSYLLGILINYFFDCYYPLIGIGSAPTQKLVQNVMFAYARQFRDISPDLLESFWEGPKTPRMSTSEGHYFEGIVTTDPTSMQGRHGPNVVILLDEAVGIKPEMFEALESIMIGDNVKVLAIYNPTDPSSYIAQAEKRDSWKTITMSAYDHPNIWEGVERLSEGRKSTEDLSYPGAINLERFEQLLKQWSDRIDKRDYDPARDIILPSSLLYDELEYYRPGPIAAARLLGRWAETSMNSVYSEYEINKAAIAILPAEEEDMVTIGVDVARYGSDFSAFCVRHGGRIYELFEVNGLNTVEVVARTVALSKVYSDKFEVPMKSIDIAIDSIGIGGGVCDILNEAGYNVHEINVAERASNSEAYFNLRTELWFEVHDLFVSEKVSLVRIEKHIRDGLSKQLLSPMFKYDRWGRRQLETKDITKTRLGRSPDTADALMLAFAANSEFSTGISGVRD